MATARPTSSGGTPLALSSSGSWTASTSSPPTPPAASAQTCRSSRDTRSITVVLHCTARCSEGSDTVHPFVKYLECRDCVHRCCHSSDDVSDRAPPPFAAERMELVSSTEGSTCHESHGTPR